LSSFDHSHQIRYNFNVIILGHPLIPPLLQIFNLKALSKMQISFLVLFTAMVAVVKPAFTSRRVTCIPNSLESHHLGHAHDINTGDLFVGGLVKHAGLKIPGGSGCIPEWDQKGSGVGPGPLDHSVPAGAPRKDYTKA
jgi:hypothetical protein